MMKRIIICIMPFLCWSILTLGQKNLSLGKIEELESAALHEKRVVNIYLPDDYNFNDSNRYPVIYLLDGSIDEDFVHIAGLVQFCSFEWVGWLPKSIVVGIANTDRKRDFTFPSSNEAERKAMPRSGHSDQFIKFIEEELQPFINGKYKTTAAKTLIGQSLGGLLATEIVLKKRKLFNNYIIVSPSLWWSNGFLLEQNFETVADTAGQHTNIYIGVGKEGLAPSQNPHVMEVDANMLADKLSRNKGIHLWFDYLPQENHATAMHQAVLNAFRMMRIQ